jgi:predicted double-glycine peptidase
MKHQMERASSAFVARTLSWVRAIVCPSFVPTLSVALSLAAGACGSVYTGSASTLKPNELQQEAGWVQVQGVPELRQKHELDCGPTALAMVLGYHGGASKDALLAELPEDQRSVVTQLRDVAKKHGFNAYVMEGKPEDLVYELQHGRPVIVGVAKPTLKDAVAHYEVVVGLHRDSQRVATIDPAVGLRQNTFSGFLTEWQGANRVLLVVIPKEPSQAQAAAP